MDQTKKGLRQREEHVTNVEALNFRKGQGCREKCLRVRATAFK